MAGLKVAVIMGGTSLERRFSLESGRAVAEALDRAGHEVVPLDADEHLVDTLRAERPDVAFVCLHGTGGEDGSVPALLEFLRIPFVGSRSAACRAAWNKPDVPFVMRRTFSPEESRTIWPPEVALSADAFRDLGAASALDLVAERIGSGYPLAVKPAHGGSALGVSKVSCLAELGPATMRALEFDDAVLFEQWVEGCELSCAVVEEDEGPRVLLPVEIDAGGEVYDTEARLDPSRVACFCPPRASSLGADEDAAARALAALERSAAEVFRAFGCRDLARVDLIWDGTHAMILDVKTFPGLAATSLVPTALAAAGVDAGELLDRLVRRAYERGC